ncbi:MAG TPA: flavoprotein [Verrucomicrobiales bacterium]|nr:flavoprotein [Roseibacillus sp.]HBM76691.1 flavoprotein [Verrucomicrobiales bacterium]|tara:strand:+ start:396 stop:926 length:531 start_codon:yes stop_codon:yes gene_type:complete
MKILIVSCSLHPESRSRRLAGELESIWRATGRAEISTLDLRDLELPACDGTSAYGHPDTVKLQGIFKDTDAVVLAVPIYNYDINAAAKNAIELAGRQLTGKVAGFLCSAGGERSYMSVMAVANSLMLDFRTVILPRFVYAGKSDVSDSGELSNEIRERVTQFGEEFLTLAQALQSA